MKTVYHIWSKSDWDVVEEHDDYYLCTAGILTDRPVLLSKSQCVDDKDSHKEAIQKLSEELNSRTSWFTKEEWDTFFPIIDSAKKRKSAK
jgi:hypothetical protein